MRLLLGSLPLLLVLFAKPAVAGELTVASGFGTSNLTSKQIPILIQHDWLVGEGALHVVVRTDLDVNADRPEGVLMKGGDLVLGAGLEWQSAPAEQVRLVVGGLAGPFLHWGPGYGLAARAVVGARIPLSGSRLWLAVEANGVVGVGTIGDENPRQETIRQAQFILGLGVRL